MDFQKNNGRTFTYILYIKNTITKGFIDLQQVFNDLFSHEERDPIYRAAGFLGSIATETSLKDFMNNIGKYAESFNNGTYKRYIPLYEGIDPVESSSSINKDRLSEPEKPRVLPKETEKSLVGFSTHLKAQDLKKKGRTFEEIRKELKLTHSQMREIFSDYVAAVSHNLDASYKNSDYLRLILGKKN